MAKPKKIDELEIEDTEAEEQSTEGLVAMTKKGETIHVHPTCVKAHEKLEWVAE